ncbi:LysE/ArgO family amino acid transporter [Actinospica sp.]|jgi:L-lysine exporter family protein LysE/ArgO|uniref:LysE/ArgO family amino acid transporter n=1 Tax=Actinospica sp. TaxID=1872142 RepID=UPI002CA1791D|nr:LysE/ArgO family amino acid transporter [Actinospica sp.]HWG25302.1 LysE/ArgO family amino acid transporter [Actinospica sp.]
MTQDLLALVAGLGTGLSLIVAIGAQNAFVLRQGLRREHVPAIVTVCAVSDLLLITAGVAGLGALVELRPGVLTVIAWAGAAFLVTYGVLAARRALRPGALRADDGEASARPSMRGSVLTCVGLTWLNPHVYLDTVLLLGSVAAGYGTHRWMFAVGACTASVLWFCGLGFGARFARPLFARPLAWRVLDSAIAVTMIVLGIRIATLR